MAQEAKKREDITDQDTMIQDHKKEGRHHILLNSLFPVFLMEVWFDRWVEETPISNSSKPKMSEKKESVSSKGIASS